MPSGSLVEKVETYVKRQMRRRAQQIGEPERGSRTHMKIAQMVFDCYSFSGNLG